MISPQPLKTGDTIALLCPASTIDSGLISGASETLVAEGFRPLVLPTALGKSGSYSGTADERLRDLQAAIDNPEVKAIICGRGGYGAVHLLDRLNVHRPVWIAGFSDISALHALWHSNGFRSIHSSMAKELALGNCIGNEANRRFFEILRTGRMPAIEFPATDMNRKGRAEGILRGGNLAVLDALVGTPYDLLCLSDSILVIEDIAEPIYKVERMLWRLKLAGVFDRLKGLIVGQFTDYHPSEDWPDMNVMIANAVAGYDFPVAFDAPFGHFDGNLPFIEGTEILFEVNNSVKIIET